MTDTHEEKVGYPRRSEIQTTARVETPWQLMELDEAAGLWSIEEVAADRVALMLSHRPDDGSVGVLSQLPPERAEELGQQLIRAARDAGVDTDG